MTPDEQLEIDQALEGLLKFEKRLTQYALDLLDTGDEDVLTPMVRDAIGRVTRIRDYIDYIAVEIADGEGGRGKAVALTILNVLLLDLEYFFRVAINDVPMEGALIEDAKKRAEHARSFIERKPASFYNEIVSDVFKEHVDASGPWRDRPSKLARKLKPEIDRRALAGGGTDLQIDTITRRLKALMAPTQH